MITFSALILAALVLARVLCWGAHASRSSFTGTARRRFHAIVAALSIIVFGALGLAFNFAPAGIILLAGVALLFFADRRGPFRKLKA